MRARGGGGLTRRGFLGGAIAGVAGLAAGGVWGSCGGGRGEPVFVGRAGGYGGDLRSVLLRGLGELGIGAGGLRGRRVLLKPNLVETRAHGEHVNTHPLLVRAAAEAFLHLGAAVLVAEGPGHRRDTRQVLAESGLEEVLAEDALAFHDVNYRPVRRVANAGGRTGLRHLVLPRLLDEVDWVVSMPKMKTHHWVGATLSLKNLFGLMPGACYGWPKNVLHEVGIPQAIHDVAATVGADLAIVDGIVGMEGDGPILGDPRPVGVVVMGRALGSVDATCARIMGIDPRHLSYLAHSGGRFGAIDPDAVPQVGERPAAVATPFRLLDRIPAQRGIAWGAPGTL